MSARRRILYIGGNLPSRSETFVYREIFALRERGIDVVAASVRAPERGLGDQRLEQLASEVIEIYGMGAGRQVARFVAELSTRPFRTISVWAGGKLDAVLESDIPPSRRPKVIWQCLAGIALARRVRPLDIDHVHAHMAHVPATVAMYCARQLNVPFSFTGHAVDLFRQRTMLRAKLRRASFVACISAWHREFYREIEPAPDAKRPIIRCGVDVTDFAPVDREFGAERPVRLLGVGRLVPKKGFDVLIESIAELKREGMPFDCDIAGEGPERPHLERLIRKHSLEDRVRLLGAVANDDVRQLMNERDVFVLPCRIDATGDRDGIPVVLMEAMACGLTVVSGDLPAIRELVEDEGTGMLVDPGSTSALSRALQRVTSDAAFRRRLADAGRRRVVEEFSLDVNVARLATAFDAVEAASRNSVEEVVTGHEPWQPDSTINETAAARSATPSTGRR
jgi:glycosyltransferase involved in cell wall biosynthesis